MFREFCECHDGLQATSAWSCVRDKSGSDFNEVWASLLCIFFEELREPTRGSAGPPLSAVDLFIHGQDHRCLTVFGHDQSGQFSYFRCSHRPLRTSHSGGDESKWNLVSPGCSICERWIRECMWRELGCLRWSWTRGTLCRICWCASLG